MMTSPQTKVFSDLLSVTAEGKPQLLEGVHPLPELLNLTAEQVLARFKLDQQRDFQQIITQLDDPENPLFRLFDALRQTALSQPGSETLADIAVFKSGEMERLFLELHEHVMDHPVWRHPFFVRVFNGDFDQVQLTAFAKQYFNQIKNTRQCVALALGRFAGVNEMPYGCLNERISELTQIVLAQLLADEYGVGSHSIDDYPSMSGLFESVTHIVMYRQIFEGLGVPFTEQDVPMLPGVADNVLIQRLVAGDGRFSSLEALASVGLGMEWGVPEFFSLLLGGMIRFAWQHEVPLTRRHLHVFIAHVQYDVLHAISVMMVTSFFTGDEDAVARIKNAVNMLMSGRYAMMSDVYRYVFDEPCAGIQEINLESRYQLTDRRIEQALREARARVAVATVIGGEAYRQREDVPFVFVEGV